MYFTIDKESLLNGLNIVSKALISTSIINRSLSGIKISASNSELVLITNSGDIAIKNTVKSDKLVIKEEGSVVLPGKVFIEMIRKIDFSNIEISLVDTKVNIKSGSLAYNLSTFDLEDYPSVDFLDFGNKISFSAKILKEITKEVVFAAATNDNKKPILQGVNFKYNNASQTLVNRSTDSFRLAMKTTKELVFENSFEFTLAAKTLDDLSRVLDYYEGDLELYVHNNKVLFKFENTLFQSRLLDGDYPETDRIIPKEFKLEIPFVKDDILRAIDEVSVTSSKDNNSKLNHISFKLRLDNVMEISANNETGTSRKELSPSGDFVFQPIEFKFNLKYLVDAIRSINSNEVKLCYFEQRKPIVIKSSTNDNLIHLIIPLVY